MLLFQYNSHIFIFVSASPVLHFISSTYAFCFLPLLASFLHTHSMSTPLRSIRFATYLPLPVMVPTCNVANLSLIFLASFHSSFLSFFHLHCFPSLLCIQVVCPPVTLGSQSLVTIVVIPGLDRSSMKSDTTRIEKHLARF